MYTSISGPTVYFDVDNTLVYSQAEYPDLTGPVLFINNRAWIVEEQHVESIRDFAARGHVVVVWSAGGSEWAKLIVDALGLSDLVAACLTKPTWYFDDISCDKFMPLNTHYYKGQISNGS